jgi:predicted PurR-regulated permease PerM
MIKLKKKHISVDISFGSIFWVLFSLIAIRFIANIMDVLFLLFSAILITLAVCPLVDWLEKRKINRRLSSFAILFSFFGIIIGTGVSLAKPLSEQLDLFFTKLPSLLDNLGSFNIDVNQLTSQLVVPSQVYRIAIGTAEGFVTGFAVLVLSFYMIQELHNLENYLEYWFGKVKGEKYFAITKKLEEQIGNWVRGEMLLMVSLGVMSYIGYTLLGLPYTLALGLMAGLLELVPNIGPTLAFIPAALVGLAISPGHALGALAIAVGVQQLEHHIIVPMIMKKTIGLNPIVTIVVLITALRLGGPILGVLALPLVLSLRVILAHTKLNKETNIPEIN